MPGLLLTYSSDDVRCYIGIIFNVYRILSGLGECKYMQGSLLIIYDLHGLNRLKNECWAWKCFYGLAIVTISLCYFMQHVFPFCLVLQYFCGHR